MPPTFTLPGAALGGDIIQYEDYLCAHCMVGLTGVLSADARSIVPMPVLRISARVNEDMFPSVARGVIKKSVFKCSSWDNAESSTSYEQVPPFQQIKNFLT